MDYTKKIIYQSNYWYNDGLKKAQIRDMSGAVVSLRRSLQYNRGNIAARNLLGLVYYGRGEVAEGLVEWIISKNLKPHDNIANYFINKVQNSASRLETINQAVKKYNQCLAYCAQNGEDLAVIQLKKVILDHPSFLKAYQLLALLYLHTEQYAKARQILKTARKLDTTNEMTLRYIHELMTVKGKKSRKKEKSKKGEAVEYHLGNETIIQPKNSAVRELAGHFTVMNILVGAAIGAAIVWFLVAPAVNQSKTAAHNKEILEYSEKIHSLESQASALQKTLDNYRISGENAEKDVQTAEQTKESYENLLAASSQYDSGSYSEDVIADTLINVNRDVLGEGAQARFDEMTGNIYPTACDIKYSAGNESLEVANYENAVTQLSAVVKMNESYDDGGALLNLGLAYMGNGDNDNAIIYLKRLIELFPDTEKAAQAQTNLDTISSQQASENQNTEE
ncbi:MULTISPECIES: tetratricopeptide repeat protein [Lachnospiraceae]|uniref:Tetratricopeptide repeat protein n=1 Tax=Faecalicatena acetigenes TaxID=2981790 RepID=A0ABT2T7Q9_9FIRM|nr:MULTISPECIES: tetratricopeptide repeat protein [Lachnospiraceae]MCU6746288.1 tetratricopeptide repeat protein [Faecalicatena acetigenes]RGT73753.1 tetratricopeptide repeat protein [Ruminococcus sp. AF18-22]SCH05628.1 Predicted O-linked N-acetylglucosamine transferase%2C SPINDLY family [uncultured Clostridium sp.]